MLLVGDRSRVHQLWSQSSSPAISGRKKSQNSVFFPLSLAFMAKRKNRSPEHQVAASEYCEPSLSERAVRARLDDKDIIKLARKGSSDVVVYGSKRTDSKPCVQKVSRRRKKGSPDAPQCSSACPATSNVPFSLPPDAVDIRVWAKGLQEGRVVYDDDFCNPFGPFPEAAPQPVSTDSSRP